MEEQSPQLKPQFSSPEHPGDYEDMVREAQIEAATEKVKALKPGDEVYVQRQGGEVELGWHLAPRAVPYDEKIEERIMVMQGSEYSGNIKNVSLRQLAEWQVKGQAAAQQQRAGLAPQFSDQPPDTAPGTMDSPDELKQAS
jgi:hypothetical protein